MAKTTEELLEDLKENGERITTVRRALIQILSKDHQPISVQEILQKLKERSIIANKTTVYRQLETLLKYNFVHEVRLSDRSVLYELANGKDHHHHLVCLGCGSIEDVSFRDDLERQEKNIIKSKKFKIIRHSLEFFGWCLKCQKKYGK